MGRATDDLGDLTDKLKGLVVGANYTVLDSEVEVPGSEQQALAPFGLDEPTRRLAERGMSSDDVERRLANQMPSEEMSDAADVLVDGSASLAATARQVDQALDALLAGGG